MWENFKDFLGRPYSDDMTALDWFWFLGLIIVLSALWAIILGHIRKLAQ